MTALAQALLQEIEFFLTESGLTPTEFGVGAVNSADLVPNLRAGKTVTLRTADKSLNFIEEYRLAHPRQRPVPATDALIADIWEFLRETSMSPHSLSLKISQRSYLIQGFLNGKSMYLETVERLVAFMAEERARRAK